MQICPDWTLVCKSLRSGNATLSGSTPRSLAGHDMGLETGIQDTVAGMYGNAVRDIQGPGFHVSEATGRSLSG